MACDSRNYWYKEINGKRLCSLSGDFFGYCDITFGVIDLTPLNWLANRPDCRDLMDDVSLMERLDEDSPVTVFEIRALCKQHDVHTIISLLTSLGIPLERIEIRESLLSEEDQKAIVEKGIDGVDAPNILTLVETDALGLSLSFNDLLGLNKLVHEVLNSNRKVVIVEFILGDAVVDENEENARRYWVIIENPEPIIEYVTEEKTEESGKQENKEHEEEEKEQGEEKGE